MNNEKDIVMRCSACQGLLTYFGQRMSYNYYLCRSCGTIQLFPQPTPHDLASLYSSAYLEFNHYEHDPLAARKAYLPYYKTILHCLKKYNISGTVLECGSGWGGLLELMLRNGIICQGIEISKPMLHYCRNQNLPVDSGDLNDLNIKGPFKALVMCLVFEHLIGHDEWLLKAGSLLEKDGYLLSFQPVPAFGKLIFRFLKLFNSRAAIPDLYGTFSPPWHTTIFSPKGMRFLADRNGFELVDIMPGIQGRAGGLKGLTQRLIDLINWLPGRLTLIGWPFFTCALFVMKKR
ncbi:MAG TPA: class I SAM-dependent methyltransferase [archaeon]|nr:class I SAM-dependent methyltransferase [archaeon]